MVNEISETEIAFGKLGFKKYENENIIIWYFPYPNISLIHNDITFCKRTGKIILYQGTNYGSDAYRCDYKLLNAIRLQSEELGFDKEREE